MAYNNGTLVDRIVTGNYLTLIIDETDAATASQTRGFEIPRAGEIVRIKSVLQSGAGSTVRPSAYYDDAGTTAVNIWEQAGAAAAADIDDATTFGYFAPTGLLYLESNVDSGTNNSIRTIITIRM